MAEYDLQVLKAMMREQQGQIKMLHELSKHIIGAYVACRESHADVVQQHRALCDCLCARGFVSRRDLILCMQARRSACFLGEIRIACTIVQFVGCSTACCLLATSRFCITDLSGPMSKTDGSTPRSERSEEPVGGSGFSAVLQEVWQYDMMSELVRSAMDTKAMQQLCAVSRAGRECMRTVSPPWQSAQARAGRERMRTFSPPSQSTQVQRMWERLCRGVCAVDVALSSTVRTGGLPPAGTLNLRFPRRDEAIKSDEVIKSDEGTTQQRPVDLAQARMVKLFGLKLRSDLNGTMGLIVVGNENCTGRHNVLLSTGETVRIRPANIEVLFGSEDDPVPSHEVARTLLSWGHVPRSVMINSPFWNATAVGMGKLFVCGGLDEGESVLDSVECFDVARGTWSLAAPLREPRSDAKSVLTGSALYVVGGFTRNRKVSGSLECFDFRAGKWRLLPSMPVPRICCGVGMVSGCIYVCGGYTQHPTSSSLVERFDPITHTWQTMPPMFQERAWMMVATVGKQLYVFGGIAHQNTLRTIERFDPAVASWKILAAMSQRRCSSATAQTGQIIYIFGGLGPEPLRSAERFCTVTQTWEQLPPMHKPKVGLSTAVAHKGHILVCCSNSHSSEASIEAFCVSDSTWTLLSEPIPNQAALIAEGAGRVYICGGTTNAGRVSGRLQCLELDTLRLSELPPMKTARDWAAGAMCFL